MAIEAVAAIAAKEVAVEAAKEAALQAGREIAQKMATEAGAQGAGNELQTAMMERQTMQDGFRVGEMSEGKGEGRGGIHLCASGVVADRQQVCRGLCREKSTGAYRGFHLQRIFCNNQVLIK